MYKQLCTNSNYGLTKSSIGDSSMDEETMETVDRALSAVFRRRAASNVKKQAKGTFMLH